MIQWISASRANKKLKYCSFGEKKIEKLPLVLQHCKDWTVQKLFNFITQTYSPSKGKVFDLILNENWFSKFKINFVFFFLAIFKRPNKDEFKFFWLTKFFISSIFVLFQLLKQLFMISVYFFTVTKNFVISCTKCP